MILSLSGKTNLQQVEFKRTETASLLEYAEENRHSGLFNDVTITVGDDMFPANRMVLSCFSRFFEAMFKTDMKEKYEDSVEITNVDGNSVKNLIEFIYTGSILIDSENVCDFLSASDYLQIEDVKQFCFEFLSSAISSENCFVILALADRYRNDELTNQVEKFIADNFGEISCTFDFKNLSKSEMMTCISKLNRDKLEETTIYNAVIGWTQRDLENRECQFSENFELVRLNELPSEFLCESVSTEKLVTGNLACSKMLLPVLKGRLSKLDQKTRIISFGGVDSQVKVIEAYNIFNERKREYPDLPIGRYFACSVSLHNSVYLIGGSWKGAANLVSRMDLTEDVLKWEDMPPMNMKRYNASATTMNDILVVVGGISGEGSSLSSGECFNPVLNSWQSMPSMKCRRFSHGLVVCKGLLYSVGGFSGKSLATVERYNPPTHSWVEIKPMLTARSSLAVVNCNDVIYAIGGHSGDGSLKSAEKYDVENDEWAPISDMNFIRYGVKACVMQGKIYAVGGRGPNDHIWKEIECYDPSTDEWCIVGSVDVQMDLFRHTVVAV